LASIEIYDDLIFLKQQPILILNIIAKEFIILLQVKAMLDEQKNSHEISKVTNIKEFILKKYISQCANISRNKLIWIIKNLAELDYKIKTGQVIAEIELKNFIISIFKN
jgi:DNA polymerase-3 subunit delta